MRHALGRRGQTHDPQAHHMVAERVRGSRQVTGLGQAQLPHQESAQLVQRRRWGAAREASRGTRSGSMVGGRMDRPSRAAGAELGLNCLHLGAALVRAQERSVQSLRRALQDW